MKRLLRILLLDYLIPPRRRHPKAEAAASRGRWRFETDCGSGRVTIVVRDTDGKLIHQEPFAAGDFDQLLAVARSILLLADPGSPPTVDEVRPNSFPRLAE